MDRKRIDHYRSNRVPQSSGKNSIPFSTSLQQNVIFFSVSERPYKLWGSEIKTGRSSQQKPAAAKDELGEFLRYIVKNLNACVRMTGNHMLIWKLSSIYFRKYIIY